MEHYFIYICNETSLTKEQTLVVNYINSLFPQEENISHLYQDLIPLPLLKCSSIYLSVIRSCLELEENASWMKVDGKVTLNHLISTPQQKIGDQEKENVVNEQILSSCLNSLADQLPSCGSYKLDLIISQDILMNLSINKDIEFTGSLYRIFRWHMAHTTIIVLDETNQSSFQDWCEIMDAELLNGHINPILGPVVWRGSIQYNELNASANSYPGFQFRLDPVENEIVFNDASANVPDIEKSQKHLIVSPVLQVIDECSFASIPVYLILPVAFRICLCEENIFNCPSKKLLESLRQKNGAALIVRLGYSLLTEKPKPDKSLSTSKWLKMVSSANIKCPDGCFPVTEKYLTFAVTASQKTGQVVAYPLRDPFLLDAKFYFSVVNTMELLSSRPLEAIDASKCDDFSELKLPHLSQVSFQSLINKINVLEVKQKCCINEHLSSDGNCCLSSLLECTTRDLSCSSEVLNQKVFNIIKEEIDPSDWFERVYLLQKQIQNEKEKKTDRLNVFLSLSPQRSESSISFASQDADKYFQPSGEAKDPTNTESLPVVNINAKQVEQDFEKLVKSEWPEVLKYSYDDIYYNRDKQAEDKELIGNEMVKFYVQHETASTCNRQQIKLDPTIIIRTKSKASKQKWRKPTTPKSFLRLKQNLLKYGDKGEKSVPNTVSNVKSASKLRKSNSETPSTAATRMIKKIGKQLVKRNSLPIRCSPRKKSKVEYSQPSTSRNTGESKRKNSDPSQLPELLKKKLRNAVASALEKHGINLSDPFFRPCGKRLFAICQAFVQDIPLSKGSTSERMQKIADAHVKQVIEFERQKEA